MLSIGQRIYLERIRRGVSQTQLSRRTGIAQANLSNIETGKQDITVSTFLQICLGLGVRPSRILDTAVRTRQRARLTRARLEGIAASVVGHVRPSSNRDREIVRLLRKNMGIGRGARLSAKEANICWADLRKRLADEEIEALRQRVQDALQRSTNEKEYR